MKPVKPNIKTKSKGKTRVKGVFVCLGLLSAALIGRTCIKSIRSVGLSTVEGILPRRETLYLNGLIWEPPTHFNPYNPEGSVFGITPFAQVSSQLIYETLFIYNILDGKLYPQLGETYTWNGMNMTVILNKDATFSDGHPMTAEDVVNSYELQKKYQTGGTVYWFYIESVTATDDYTIVIKSKPAHYNPKQVEASISALYITPKHVWDKILPELDDDNTTFLQYSNWDPIGTGPYKPYLSNEAQVVLQRVDSYWGQISSKHGKLPIPKYIAHTIFNDKASGEAAFRAGEVDVSQQFIPQIWSLWESGLPVETYVSLPPYYLPGTIPFLIFNTKRPGLDDPSVRRALAIALDYDLIGQSAIGGYTAPMTASLMLPVPMELDLIDADALKPYHRQSVALDDAKILLDQAGWAQDSMGSIRTKGGVRLSFTAECPIDSFDGQAALEAVSQTGKALGMDIKPTFSIPAVWQANKENGTFDITIHSHSGLGPASPWNRAYQILGSADLPLEDTPNHVQNWGRWIHVEANDIIAKIALETDPVTLKKLWTRLNIIYLQNIPCIGLMYRPLWFHTVNTSIWEGFPAMNDGFNIPPTLCIDGYGIMALYKIKPRETEL